jgi:catalase
MKKLFTTDLGTQVSDDQNSITAGEREPVLIQDARSIEKLAHISIANIFLNELRALKELY